MKVTCQSEVGRIKSVYIKHVRDAFSNELRIANQWEELNFLSKPNLANALREYDLFEKILIDHVEEIFHFPENESVSIDSIYCRDAIIPTDHGLIVCNMGKKQRKPEPTVQLETLSKRFKVLGEIVSPGTIEAGDVAWLDKDTLAIGHTYRTNKEGIRQMSVILRAIGVTVIAVDLPHYNGPSEVLHLMSIFSPVDKDLAVVYSPLMPLSFRNELLEREYQLVEVPPDEFPTLGCNVLALAPRKCIAVKGNTITVKKLRDIGCTVWEVEGNDIGVKGGGGPTCLTRPIERYITD